MDRAGILFKMNWGRKNTFGRWLERETEWVYFEVCVVWGPVKASVRNCSSGEICTKVNFGKHQHLSGSWSRGKMITMTYEHMLSLAVPLKVGGFQWSEITMATWLWNIPRSLTVKGMKSDKLPVTKSVSHKDEKHSTGNSVNNIIMTFCGDRRWLHVSQWAFGNVCRVV